MQRLMALPPANHSRALRFRSHFPRPHSAQKYFPRPHLPRVNSLQLSAGLLPPDRSSPPCRFSPEQLPACSSHPTPKRVSTPAEPNCRVLSRSEEHTSELQSHSFISYA